MIASVDEFISWTTTDPGQKVFLTSEEGRVCGMRECRIGHGMGEEPAKGFARCGSHVVPGSRSCHGPDQFKTGVLTWQQLNHTFALNQCPHQILGGQPPTIRDGAFWFDIGSIVFYLRVRCIFTRVRTRSAVSERLANGCDVEWVFPQVRP